jgi:hypothetical protein
LAKRGEIMLTQKRKFNKSNYLYNLVNWDNKSCIDEDCNNPITNATSNIKSMIKFCSRKCQDRRYSFKVLPSYYYHNRCKNCNKYFLSKQAGIYCSIKCSSKKYYQLNTKAIGKIYCEIQCNYRYCNNLFTTYNKKGIPKLYCSNGCKSLEGYHKNKLPALYKSHANKPRYLYLMYNKEHNCFKYGITNHKSSRLNTHKRLGFELLEKRYYPKNAIYIEQYFKHYLKSKFIKPAMSYNNMKDGWTETVSAKDIPNLTINMISKIYKEK